MFTQKVEIQKNVVKFYVQPHFLIMLGGNVKFKLRFFVDCSLISYSLSYIYVYIHYHFYFVELITFITFITGIHSLIDDHLECLWAKCALHIKLITYVCITTCMLVAPINMEAGKVFQIFRAEI